MDDTSYLSGIYPFIRNTWILSIHDRMTDTTKLEILFWADKYSLVIIKNYNYQYHLNILNPTEKKPMPIAVRMREGIRTSDIPDPSIKMPRI